MIERLVSATWSPTLTGKPDNWQVDGLCGQTDPDLFFPEDGGSSGPAKRICRECPVRVRCLEEALTDPLDQWGVRGGTSPKERGRLRVLRRSTT